MKPIVTKKYLALFGQSSRQRILGVLCKWPEQEFSLSELAKKARVAKTHIGPLLKEFEAMGIIRITELSSIWRIRPEQQNESFIRSKILYNLSFIYHSGLVEILNKWYGNPKAIILFGSFRKGDDISTSDIDIAIESDNKEEEGIFTAKETTGFLSLELVKFKTEFEPIIGSREIQIHVFNRKSVDINVFNNIANGIVLCGFLEVRK